ncbi:EAL domain-containing protein [Lyngbya confervoides]|uniref:EAL domain-containing protein n=1 Tax=Lyngbya confervoides BDU141951 TaxID=1574623 RepID=A0ABD4T0F2_9CYAN|nr:EAL domain-containing protein [Lyngbya confervoides]MCM1982098.1 EAL domain-containing protein [Lyngbya confervoides BDU141951]
MTILQRENAAIRPEVLSTSLKLLLIEDAPEDIELIVLTLESAGFNFTYDTALSAEQCRNFLQTREYDIVLSDYRLPLFNGRQAFDLLQASPQEIPFILVTGSLGEEAAVECIKAGMTDYVLKERLFRLPTVLDRALKEFDLRQQQKAAIAQIQQQAWRDSIVNHIIQSVRKTLVLDEILQKTVDQLHTSLQVSRCLIFKPASTAERASAPCYLSSATVNREQLIGQPCALYSSHESLLMQDETVVIHNLAENYSEALQAEAQSFEIQSLVLVPLIYQQTYWGGICLQQCDRQRTWTPVEVELLEAVANQCAIAIHQAQLYEQAQRELAQRKRIEAQLRHDAFHDTLTGLPNRALLLERLEHALQMQQRRSRRSENKGSDNSSPLKFAVLFLDLDRFKVINDSLGHNVGDALLRQVSTILKSCLRMGDMVARLGGDEFVLLLEEINDATDAIEVAKRVHQAFIPSISLEGQEVFVSTSVGIAISSPAYRDPTQMLRDADLAMYRAKRQGCGGYAIFDEPMHQQALQQLQIETDLRHALERGELCVYFQPIVALDHQGVQGFEALVRWQHPTLGLLSPAVFIPLAEDTGLILEMDFWVLETACKQLQAWQAAFPLGQPLTMNVNLSGRQFTRPDLLDRVDQVLQNTGIPGSCVKLEITETVLIENPQGVAVLLSELQERNIQVCLDDFGTGYSSLSYLNRFPVNQLKIDRSFVALLDTHSRESWEGQTRPSEQTEIVRAIANLAANLGLQVVAEGVENQEQLQYLQSIHCDSAQGYYFAPPLDSDGATEWLQQFLQQSG